MLTDLVLDTYLAIAYDADLCTDTIQITISQPGELLLSGTIQKSSGASIADGAATVQTVTGGTPPYSYNWSNGSVDSAGISGLLPGFYTAIVSDAHDCSATALFEIGFISATTELDHENKWSIFPNPANDWFLIKCIYGSAKNWHYQFFNNGGAILREGNFASSAVLVDVQALPAGVYFLEIDNHKGSKQSWKVLLRD